ncbi:LysR family transcriptional regulator [uncultured Modestobacter sp.]|uniref:LysR family transcriptional regulator n=1 Tax=uncultured Modestobacter sp. TaxID=380048 RepID=UPI0026296DF6|nr:LysR family transcriptional regulator [uncultured Modestobacter sp.]
MQLDLNLLTALDALLEQGSVTAAADRLHLSVPAMSRTLGRIRRATGDPILVRTGRTMTPTPYAVAVREEVQSLLARANAVLTPPRDVDPATLERTFSLRVHDALATALAPGLLAAVAAEAPGVRLRLLAETANDAADDARQGRVDLAIGAGSPPSPEFRAETVGTDRLVVIGRPGHPALAAGPDLAAYAAARHLTVSRRGRLQDPVDDALAARGLTRQVVAAAPTTATALQVAAAGDLLVTAPGRTCRTTAETLGLQLRPLPLAMPAVPVTCSWHQRYEADPAHAWLRAHVRRALSELVGS